MIDDASLASSQIVSGDVVAQEKERSRADHSLRCYKLSKSFQDITAVCECTLQVNDGTLLALLGQNGADL